MSRIDYLTIFVVGVSIIFLGLLIYFVIQGVSDGQDKEAEVYPQDEYDKYFEDESLSDDTYDISNSSADPVMEEDEVTTALIQEEDEAPQSFSNTESVNEGSSSEAEYDESEDVGESVSDDDTGAEVIPEPAYVPTVGNNEGDFLVIAGSFSIRENADKYTEKLRSLGYTNTITTPFEKGKLNVVLVDRYSEKSQAQAAVRELKKEHGLDAYVQEKQNGAVN